MIRALVVFLAMMSGPVLADYQGVPNVYDGIQEHQCPEFFPFDVRIDDDTNLVTICRINYAVIYDTDCKIPILVFEHLTASRIDGVEPRSKTFRPDPSLYPEHSASLSDYRNSGYDRGHMVPAGDMQEDSVSMLQTFYLSNVIPQAPQMNRGLWSSLEEFIRENVEARGELPTYVITGAHVGDRSRRIGDGVCVPTDLYKIITTEEIIERVVYLVPNRDDARGPLRSYVVKWPVFYKKVEPSFWPW
jgi:endonuclease G